jgi:Rps23 Pro-64 3,4-dihydroxylase Tpa1-like proline 4-hydroxylase
MAHGGVAVLPQWLPDDLATRMRRDAQSLFAAGYFVPDGLTNTALTKEQQDFSRQADRQTFRGGDGWHDRTAGDYRTRAEFSKLMTALRLDLAEGLDRPTLAPEGVRKHETTYNWYEPGAQLGRHLDEHHEETKGPKGWQLPTRRSVTWLVYLNDAWSDTEGGALHCYPRRMLSDVPVGAHEGNLQVGWIDDTRPVFLDAWRESGQTALYVVTSSSDRHYISAEDFDVPSQPIDFRRFLRREYQGTNRFEQISTAQLDSRFVKNQQNTRQATLDPPSTLLLSSSSLSTPKTTVDPQDVYTLNVMPAAGTLVLFDSVTLPHRVQEVTGQRQRIAATGWFHEDNQAQLLV